MNSFLSQGNAPWELGGRGFWAIGLAWDFWDPNISSFSLDSDAGLSSMFVRGVHIASTDQAQPWSWSWATDQCLWLGLQAAGQNSSRIVVVSTQGAAWNIWWVFFCTRRFEFEYGMCHCCDVSNSCMAGWIPLWLTVMQEELHVQDTVLLTPEMFPEENAGCPTFVAYFFVQNIISRRTWWK